MDVNRELAVLEAMTLSELHAKYSQVFGQETWAGKKVLLVKRITWRLEILTEDDLSDRGRQRTAELLRYTGLRLSPRKGKDSLIPSSRNRTSNQGGSMNRYCPCLARSSPAHTRSKHSASKFSAMASNTRARFSNPCPPWLRPITGSHTNGFLFFRWALVRRGNKA